MWINIFDEMIRPFRGKKMKFIRTLYERIFNLLDATSSKFETISVIVYFIRRRLLKLKKKSLTVYFRISIWPILLRLHR